MAKPESTDRINFDTCLNVEFMRSLVKQYSELGQWTSALFWADAAAATAAGSKGIASGDDIWLLSNVMLARGEFHRAAYTITSRELHRKHLLCLDVAMRSYLSANDPSAALQLLDECEPALLEPKNTDQTHNRALAGVLVTQARALSALERREASVDALTSALRADCASYEALDLLLEQHALTPTQELELIESLPMNKQLSEPEGALLRSAYRDRLQRYSSPADPPSPIDPMTVEGVRARTIEAALCRGRALATACSWREALAALDVAGPWSCADVRAACLVELNRTTDLFAFAHTLVDAYPNQWTSWYAVGCYYYLIGKNELARRYLIKAKSLEPTAGCVWLAYGHSFAAENEHDQAMAAYFKASQLMAGCHLPPLYVGVECSLLNNVNMCERFLARAAALHNGVEEGAVESCADGGGSWERIVLCVQDAHVAHEAGAAAFSAGNYTVARELLLRALHCAQAAQTHRTDDAEPQVSVRWAATLDALGHTCRKLGMVSEALTWHERALALRPGRAASIAAAGLCLALLGREPAAADMLHAALAKDPDDVVALALLDATVDRLDAELSDEEIPQFPFPLVQITVPATRAAPATPGCGEGEADATNTSDMSMSFD